MKKITNLLMTIVVTLVLLAGCSSGSESNDTKKAQSAEEGTISVIISDEAAGEVYSDEEITIQEDAILMDVMQENYDIDENDGFINEIDGVSPEEGEKKAWIYSVNGEDALVGAAEYELSIDDEVAFDLQSWE